MRGGVADNGCKQTTTGHSENTCTLTFHCELGLRAVMEGFTAVGAPVGHGQFVDTETVFSALVFQGILCSGVDEHPLPHPLHLTRVQTHLHL